MTHVGFLRGVDRAAFAVALTSRLRAGGVTTGLTAVEDVVAALSPEVPVDRRELYWRLRVCLVGRHEDLPVFDAVFAAAFADANLAAESSARRRGAPRPSAAGNTRNVAVPRGAGSDEAGSGLPWATLPPAVGQAGDAPEDAVALPERLPAAVAALADSPFADLSERETAQLAAWVQAALPQWPRRRTRRHGIDPAGHRVALRSTIARSRRTAWEPVELVRSSPRERPRRVVMLCDVSRSMQAEAAAYLHLMRALVLGADAEVFAFGVGLTRLTAVLAHRSPEVAVDRAAEQVVDRFAGTRIATSIGTLLASHHGELVRGSVVLVASDGWDSDPPDRLATAMARLQRRAYRVVWMNPRASAPDYEPRVAAMAAALPYCDALLPADTFAALGEVVRAIAALSSRASRGSRAGTARR